MNSERIGNADYLQSGGYTIVLMEYNDKREMVDTVTIMNRRPTNSLILEMTAKTTDELGSRRLFRVFDATSYTEGMNTLSLMITVNSEAKRRIMFPRALSENSGMKMVEFDVGFYKSVVIEFDMYGMRNRMIY